MRFDFQPWYLPIHACDIIPLSPARVLPNLPHRGQALLLNSAILARFHPQAPDASPPTYTSGHCPGRPPDPGPASKRPPCLAFPAAAAATLLIAPGPRESRPILGWTRAISQNNCVIPRIRSAPGSRMSSTMSCPSAPSSSQNEDGAYTPTNPLHHPDRILRPTLKSSVRRPLWFPRPSFDIDQLVTDCSPSSCLATQVPMASPARPSCNANPSISRSALCTF